MGRSFFNLQKRVSDDYWLKTLHNMRQLAVLFVHSELYLYLCRRICDVMAVVLSHKVGMRYVYTRKR